MAFLFKSKAKSPQELVKNLKEAIPKLDEPKNAPKVRWLACLFSLSRLRRLVFLKIWC